MTVTRCDPHRAMGRRLRRTRHTRGRHNRRVQRELAEALLDHNFGFGFEGGRTGKDDPVARSRDF